MDRDYTQEHAGNHVYLYQCITCYAVSISERAAQLHQEWHETYPPVSSGGGDE